jgi:C-terminal processing protease CtpA/Prc
MRYLSLLLFLLTVIGTKTLKASAIDTPETVKRFTKAQLTADVKYLTQTVEDVHPNMYHSISKKQYQKLTDSVIDQLHDGMTERQAWPLLACLIGALNEGHSTFSYADNIGETLKNGNILFPVTIREFDGKYLVVQADGSLEDQLQPGDKIISVNGVSASMLVDNLSTYAGGLRLWRANDVCRNFVVYTYLYNIQSPYRITYLRNNKVDSAVLKPVTLPDYIKRIRAKMSSQPKVVKPSGYYLNYLDNGKAYMVINSLTDSPDNFKHFLDSAFTKLKNQPSSTLIIDLRLNGGGNSSLGEMLLGYITDKPFRMAGGVRWKVSQEYKNQLNERLKGEGPQKMDYYFNKPNGYIFESAGATPEKPAKNDLLYKGKVIVLIGPKTFSSANMLANTIQDYKLATLVGQPSGEPANDYGELIKVTLPNTHFSFSTSTKQFIRANGDAKDKNVVLPAYYVIDNLLTPVDEVLEYAKKM